MAIPENTQGINPARLILLNIKDERNAKKERTLTVTKTSPFEKLFTTSKVKSIVKPKTVSGLFTAAYLKKRGSFSR